MQITVAITVDESWGKCSALMSEKILGITEGGEKENKHNESMEKGEKEIQSGEDKLKIKQPYAIIHFASDIAMKTDDACA